jgi:DNA-binding GntR family transcriptional regulator
MARYREIADDLRHRIVSGEFPVGTQLPPISALQEHYDVPGLNTIRQAQQLLVEAGMIETRQGVGAFVASTEGRGDAVDVLAELRAARKALNTAITALERTPGNKHPMS